MRPVHTLMPIMMLLMAAPAHAQTETASVLADANARARVTPSADRFSGARVVYDHAPGAIYELQTSPLYVSTLLLEPGEAITAIAAGDTSRWSVTEAEAEAENTPRALLMIKPQAANLRTNIVIVTDRRTYVVEARSSAGRAYVAEMAWSYPQQAASISPDMAGIHLDYRVRAVRGRTPQWTPVRVFDDGAQTYIDFPDAIAATDMPPLFVVSAEGAELANYRVVGQRYIVDRLFDVAELRLGIRHPIVVRIERGAQTPARPAPRRGRP